MNTKPDEQTTETDTPAPDATKVAKKAKRDASPKSPKPAVGAVRWLVRSGNKEVTVADWARQHGHKPYDVRHALRRTITDGPRVVTQAELDKALKTPKQSKRK